MKDVVGVGTMRVTNDPGAILVTGALGSGIGVALYDPQAMVGGLLRFLLPESPPEAKPQCFNPFLFAQPGISLLLQEAYKLGAAESRLQVKLAGGSNLLHSSGLFNLGAKNLDAARRILRGKGIAIQAEEVGGSVNRSIGLEVSTGRIWVRIIGEGEKDI